MRKFGSLILAAILAVSVFAGCAEKPTTEEDLSLQKVKDAKTFVMGLDDSFPPMGYRNEQNEIVGFDIDCAKEVALRMDVELELQPISWDAKDQELNSGKIDCIWNGMSVKEEYKTSMNLSDSYMKNRMVVVVLNGSGFNSIEDLKDKKIGVQSGSTAEGILNESDFAKTIKEIITFKDNVTAFLDLEAKGVDAIFVDEVVANNFITEKAKPYTILEDGALADEEYAIGFRKNDQALRDEVTKILSEMKADGKLTEISVKWFGKDVTIIK